jgi:hypothetical protein
MDIKKQQQTRSAIKKILVIEIYEPSKQKINVKPSGLCVITPIIKPDNRQPKNVWFLPATTGAIVPFVKKIEKCFNENHGKKDQLLMDDATTTTTTIFEGNKNDSMSLPVNENDSVPVNQNDSLSVNDHCPPGGIETSTLKHKIDGKTESMIKTDTKNDNKNDNDNDNDNEWYDSEDEWIEWTEKRVNLSERHVDPSSRFVNDNKSTSASTSKSEDKHNDCSKSTSNTSWNQLDCKIKTESSINTELPINTDIPIKSTSNTKNNNVLELVYPSLYLQSMNNTDDNNCFWKSVQTLCGCFCCFKHVPQNHTYNYNYNYISPWMIKIKQLEQQMCDERNKELFTVNDTNNNNKINTVCIYETNVFNVSTYDLMEFEKIYVAILLSESELLHLCNNDKKIVADLLLIRYKPFLLQRCDTGFTYSIY